MSFPRPVAGLVIRYSFLWRSEQLAGQNEGVKDRPCAIILVTQDVQGDEIVTVLPITHSPPADPAFALELPAAVKTRLGLDQARSWVVLTEANRFAWPGPDLRPAVSGDPSSVAYGFLPLRFFEQVRRQFIAALKQHQAKLVIRD